MNPETILHCLDCGHDHPYTPKQFTCPACGSAWREARYDYAGLSKTILSTWASRPFAIWRYRELLPVRKPNPELTLGEGGTPLIRAVNLGMMLGCPNIYIKDERQGPTSSFKDRQAAVTISALKEAGITEMVVASTGNVSISYSAYAARAGIKLWAFLTSLVPPEKMREVALYGTQVIKVTGSYDQAKQVAAEFARQRNLFLDQGTRTITSVEAMKTIAFEAAEQLSWLKKDANGFPLPSPDWYFQSVSGGLGPLGVLKGFQEMQTMGLIGQIPRLGIIQAEGCSPMVQAWQEGKEIATPVSPRTRIATLATGDPGRTYTLLFKNSRGGEGAYFESVSDEDAFRTMHILAKMEGLSMEPASAVAFAGMIKMVRNGIIKPSDTIVVNLTGHTVPIEQFILGENWSRSVVVPSQPAAAVAEPVPQEGLLAALSHVTRDRFPRIAIVDDNPEVRRLIRRILQAQGNYTLSEATNGREAIALAQNEHPDLMILDLMMPEVDGFGVLDALQKNKETAEIPVIVVTAKDLTKEERERLKGHIQSLMQKGDFMSDELADEVRSLIG
ncbi:MAG TPA: threonine synthase [Anaerolineaceae bacterium]|nr:threonine synthase [Anaerolineaceae bacterium]HPN52664.1 threonine synthase [Anaerolineaceae bacterium]